MDDFEMRLFGSKLKALRQRAGMTQKELADAAYLSESALRSYELGVRTPKRDAYSRLAKALGVVPESLTTPYINNGMEFIFALLANEEKMGLKVVKTSSTRSALVAEGLSGNAQLLFDFLNDWGEKQRQLEDKEITQEEYEDWKISYDPRVFVDDLF